MTDALTKPTAAVAAPPRPDEERASLLLALDIEAAETLHRDGAQLVGSAKRAVGRTLRQVVWDTPDRRIGKAGLALGIETANRRQSQILRDVRVTGAVRHEACHDSRLDRETFDLHRLAFVPGIDPGLPAELAGAMLEPAFGLDIKRTTWHGLAGAGAAIGIRLDRVTLDAAAGRERFALVELTVAAADLGAAYDIAALLLERIDLAPARLDAVQRGYRLIGVRDGEPKAAPPLDAEMTVRAGLIAIGGLGSALAGRDLARLDQDLAAEPIHQARVALRRLRSVLSVFGDAVPPASRRALGRRLNDLAQVLGAVREWDVLREATIEPLRRALGPDPLLLRLDAGAGERRDRAARRVADLLATRPVRLLLLDLDRWFGAGLWPDAPSDAEAAVLAEPLGLFARRLIRRRHRRLIDQAQDALDVEGLHELRILAKKLRYSIELLAPLFPTKPVRRYLKLLRAIQDVLGAANDAAMARQLMPILIPPGEIDGARAQGLVAGWSAASAETTRAALDDRFAAFAKAERFWREPSPLRARSSRRSERRRRSRSAGGSSLSARRRQRPGSP